MKIGLTEARIQVSKSYVNFSIDLANFLPCCSHLYRKLLYSSDEKRLFIY